jgi:hypothetical protein
MGETIDNPGRDRQVRDAVLSITIGWLSVLLMIDLHAGGGAGVGGAFLGLGVLHLFRLKHFRWCQIALIVLATLAAAFVIDVLFWLIVTLARHH